MFSRLQKWWVGRRLRAAEKIAAGGQATEAEIEDRRRAAMFQGALGSGRRTTYDEGHARDKWS